MKVKEKVKIGKLNPKFWKILSFEFNHEQGNLENPQFDERMKQIGQQMWK